jgi:hypothetical protein
MSALFPSEEVSRQGFLLKSKQEMFIIKSLAPVAQVDRAMDS